MTLGPAHDGVRLEHARLRTLLRMSEQEARAAKPMQTALFDRAPGQVDLRSKPGTKVAFFLNLPCGGILYDVLRQVELLRDHGNGLSVSPQGDNRLNGHLRRSQGPERHTRNAGR